MIKIKFKIDYKATFGAFSVDDQVTVNESPEVTALIKHGVVQDVTNGIDNSVQYGVHKILEVQNSSSGQGN